jgi:hypothetical protein
MCDLKFAKVSTQQESHRSPDIALTEGLDDQDDSDPISDAACIHTRIFLGSSEASYSRSVEAMETVHHSG